MVCWLKQLHTGKLTLVAVRRAIYPADNSKPTAVAVEMSNDSVLRGQPWMPRGTGSWYFPVLGTHAHFERGRRVYHGSAIGRAAASAIAVGR